MKIEYLDRGKAKIAMDEWICNYPNVPAIENEYVQLRNDINSLFDSVEKDIEEAGKKIQDYNTDIKFALSLYKYFSKQDWFSLRVVENDDFWRWLSLKIVPNIVAKRWGKDNESHYWSNPARIWLKQLWWYVYLSWTGDEISTESLLFSPNCTTDTILNFVERSGKKGTCVESYRKIIYLYSRIPHEKLIEFNKTRESDDLFRLVMKLNTARILVVEPDLFENGNEGYAKQLFADAGFPIESL